MSIEGFGVRRAVCCALFLCLGVGATCGSNEVAEAGTAPLGDPESIWSEAATLGASDAADSDLFGSALVAGDDLVFVGAVGDDSFAGAVYLYERDPIDPTAWNEVDKLIASDGVSLDRFGQSLALFGDILVVGAPGDFSDGIGAAYVFQHDPMDSTLWTEVAKLTLEDGAVGDLFGTSVAIDGDTLVVGAHKRDTAADNGGAVFVFDRDVGDPAVWNLTAELTAAGASLFDFFGYSIAFEGDTLLVGAYSDDDFEGNGGSVYPFQRDPSDPTVWTQGVQWSASDVQAGHEFGYAVALDGDTALVGARTNGFPWRPGSAYVFERDPSDLTSWAEIAILTASNATDTDLFGESVALAGSTALVGALRGDGPISGDEGQAYVFERDPVDSSLWNEIAMLSPAMHECCSQYAISVALHGEDSAVVGADGHDAVGAAFVFEMSSDQGLTVELSGGCPGSAEVAVQGAEPDGSVGVLRGSAPGAFTLPVFCAGTEVGLVDPQPVRALVSDAAGEAAVSVELPATACGAYMQVLDLVTCETSNVLQVP